MKNNTVRISLLGGTGSGKTSFMGGIVQALVVNAGRYGTQDESCNVMLEPKKSVSFDNDIFSDEFDPSTIRIIEGTEVGNELLEKYYMTDRFKPQTTTGYISEYEFALTINSYESCRMIISDYAGELFSSYEKNRENFPELAKKLAESDVLIIMADGVVVSDHYGHGTNLQEFLTAKTFNILFPTIVEVAKSINKKMTVLIAITKADSPRIAAQYKADNFEDTSAMLIEKAYKSIYTKCEICGWNFGIIPVSCVGDNTTRVVNTDRRTYEEIIAGADLKQKNIDIAILYSLYIHIEEMIDYLERTLERLKQETKLFSHPAGYKKADWLVKISACESNINILNYCRRVLKNHTFSNLNGIIHQRLPKNAIPMKV
ncbi:MAG: hypothetical protein ACI4KM_10315 [Oscillospiraceae bacterium]